MPPSTLSQLELVEKEALAKCMQYEWIGAAGLYQRILNVPSLGSSNTGRIVDLMARCYFRAAFQGASREEFRERMNIARDNYEHAGASYRETGSEALEKRAKARALFSSWWLEDDPAQKQVLLGKSVSLCGEAARITERQGDMVGAAEASRDLLGYFLEGMPLETERRIVREQFERVVEVGEKAISEFEALGNDEGLLESLHSTLLLLSIWFDFVLEPSEVGEIAGKVDRLNRKMVKVSEKVGAPYARALSAEAAAFVTPNFEGDFPGTLTLFEAGISVAETFKDSYLIGRMAANYLFFANWGVSDEEDAERRRQILDRAIGIAPTALKNLEISGHQGWLGATREQYASCYINLASLVETEAEDKRAHLRKAIEIAQGNAVNRHYLGTWIGDALGRALYFLATLTSNPEEKARLLRDSLLTREKLVGDVDLLRPFSVERADMRNNLALIKAQLSTIERDPRKKTELLQSAVADMQQCVEISGKWAPTAAKMSAFVHHQYNERYGDTLVQLYEVIKKKTTVNRAVRSYEDAIVYLNDTGQTSSVSALLWKVAKAQDLLGEYRKAAESFKKASKEYTRGATKIPSSAQVYNELASYMEAWSLVEEARLHHNEDQYGLAAQDYALAANKLEASRTWGHLAKHYHGCSSLEEGESLSREDRSDVAIESFSAAETHFREAKLKLESRFRQNQPNEKQELSDWLDTTRGREEYCQGRISLEKAKLLDKKGEKGLSSRSYTLASEIFKALLGKPQTGQVPGELEALVLFCQAWARMKEAEANAQPELYVEAAELFLKAEKTATREKQRVLALANASICKALESGTLFRRTRDSQLYSEIKKHLETAADFYQEARFKNAADWTRATQRLFDALVYLTDAETEREPVKKTELYHLAENHLKLAARLYGEAGFPGKREEALGYIERVREETELLLTPMEALRGNPVASSESFAPVPLVRDQALGLQRFEEANVVGSLNYYPLEPNVGSTVTIELEMTNIGKTTATLIKLENIAPSGFELVREQTSHKVEDDHVNMRGKRLEHLNTHDVKIVLKAHRRGRFQLQPRVVYADEIGNHRSYDFGRVDVKVRELGISGWLKGAE